MSQKKPFLVRFLAQTQYSWQTVLPPLQLTCFWARESTPSVYLYNTGKQTGSYIALFYSERFYTTCVIQGAVSWQAKWYCTMVPCLLMRRVQIELNRTVIVSRKPLNSVQARNQILPQVHIALQITCCLYQLILFRSAAFSPFSSTAEVIQRHQLQLRQSKRGRRCRVRNGWPEIRGKVL